MEMSTTKQNQIHIENKFVDFTKKIESQTTEMNNKIQELKYDFENLKTLNEGASNLDATTSSCSNSFVSANNTIPKVSQNFQGEAESTFYMFGDTTRTLIFDGIRETQHGNMGEIIIHCMMDIGIPLNFDDIEDVARIGKPYKNCKFPRPIKVTLKDTSIREQILFFKSRLNQSRIYKEVRIHKEERKDVRVRFAKLRQAASAAEKQGHRVEYKMGAIKIDGVEYNTLTLHLIPDKFMKEANEIRPHPKNKRRSAILDKCRTNSGRVIMVGPSIQKTPFRLAFFSIQCFLSNFYRCTIKYRGQTYICLEQGYHCTKAELCNNITAYNRIYNSNSPADMKRVGHSLPTLKDGIISGSK